MKFKLEFFFVINLFLVSSPIKAIIFFNNLIHPDGKPFYFKSDQIEGILGWIDISNHVNKVYNKDKIINEDRIFALKLRDNSYKFVLPSCPNIILPTGLYCWQSSWKKYVELNDTLYQSLTQDICIINKFKQENKPIMYAQANPYGLRFCYDFNTKDWVYHNPKIPISTIYKNSSNEELYFTNESLSADCNFGIKKQFYETMGVRENYMREYLGAEPDQFNIPLICRTQIRIPNVESEIIRQYFPMQLTLLNRDIEKLSGEFKIYQPQELKIKKLNKQNSKVTLLKLNNLILRPDNFYSSLQLLQMEPDYNDAVFTIFTNFDGLEGFLSDPKSLIEDLKLEQLSTIIANLIFRKYYTSFNLLKDLKDKIKVKNGIITEIKQYPSQQELEKIKLIFSSNVPIIYEEQIINKINYVFCPIVDLNSLVKIKSDFVQAILELAIQSACKVAKLNNKKKIVFNLTSLNEYGYLTIDINEKFNSDYFNKIAQQLNIEIILIC